MIRLLKLITGEDVISDVEMSEGAYILKNPHRLVVSREGLGSMALCPFAKSTEYRIGAANVLYEAEPDDQIRDSYATATGSIVVPSSGIVTP